MFHKEAIAEQFQDTLPLFEDRAFNEHPQFWQYQKSDQRRFGIPAFPGKISRRIGIVHPCDRETFSGMLWTGEEPERFRLEHE